MFSGRYLQNRFPVLLGAFTLLLLCVSVFAENDPVTIAPGQNETDSSGEHFERFETGATTSNEVSSSTESTTIPALSDSLFSFATTDEPSSTERPTVTVLPESVSLPSMIISATKVTLGHRLGLPSESINESNEGSTEAPLKVIDESSTETTTTVESTASEKATISSELVTPSVPLKNNHRKSRYHRYHDSFAPDVDEVATDHSGFHGSQNEFHEISKEYYREMDVEADSYGDFGDDNEMPEQLPTPMALINPNGEGNNPPLEDDFAEAFKKVNANGKRRRFRGGRRGRMKLKKLNETRDSNASGFSNTENEDNVSKASAPEWSHQSSTVTPPTVSPKLKRYRSTTPNSIFLRSSTTQSSISTEEPPNEGGPIVKHGPKPMILQSHNRVDDGHGATPLPQIEKPGNGGHTEKISTYFFSTPSPSARLRLRQKIRESLPSTLSTTTSTTEASVQPNEQSGYHSVDDSWKNQFSDFPQNPFFPEPSTNFKIPEFVPMTLGLETDDRQEPVENSLTKPDPAEDKAYSFNSERHHNSDSDSNNHGHYDTYSDSSTTPKSHKMRRPSSSTAETYSSSSSKHEYDTGMQVSPTVEMEKSLGTDYYSQGSNTEPSTAFPSSQRTTAGSHYDRTKDKVIFYNNSPYSAQHSSTVDLTEDVQAVAETTPETSSQTVGSHLSVSEGPSYYESPLAPTITIDHHHHYPSAADGSMYTRGHVYSEDVASQLDSTFKNGPPDSSHIHSPNIVENALPTDISVPSGTEHPSENPHQHHNHQSAYSPQHSFIEEPHQAMGMPGGDNIYGTVEEVPPHGNPSYEHLLHSPHHQYPPPHNMHHAPPHNMHHAPPHNMHHPPPPPDHMVPYPFDHPRSPQSPAMSYHPHNTIPLPPPPHHHEEQSLPTHPLPPPPLPPPPPSYNHMPPHYSQHHPQYHNDVHNSFAPSYEIHPNDNNINNNQPDSHLNSNHIANSPSEMSPDGISLAMSHGEQTDGHPSGSSSSPTSASPPDFPHSLLNNGPPANVDPQTVFNGPPPPPSHMDPNFAPHSHTMATHPDYEPANPPLPHDHPFHNGFIPFPQDMQLQLDQHAHDTPRDSSPPNGGDNGPGPYHPGIVENVPTGRPSSFEPSPIIPAKFTPIPDDVKNNDLYSSFVSQPYETPPPQHDTHHDLSEASLSSNSIADGHQNSQHPPGDHMSTYSIPDSHQNVQHPPSDHMSTYPGNTGEEHTSYHHHHHPSQMGPMGSEHSGKDPQGLGYSGPVDEIHSGIYQSPNGPDTMNPSISIHDHGERYPNHHEISTHDHSPNGPDYSLNDESDHSNYKPGSADEPIKHHDSYNDHGHPLHHHGPHSIKDIQDGSSDAKKEKKQRQQASFSNTPYVLMFPQLIPEEKMRPSPPSLLTKDVPVIQASSMNDFTSSGEKPPLGPGFKAVPVHPRHQMYQVLAKTHYEKMMERYRESKRKPPSAIYTPYGILVPVGTNVDAAASMNHNMFAKPRLPPKLRGEKSLLTALLGSPSSPHGRFHPPMMSNRVTKAYEYEPAIDVLAEKLAMKIVNAQKVLNGKSSKGGSQGSFSEHKSVIAEKSDGKSEESGDKVSSTRKEEDHIAMESNLHKTIANPEFKDYLKGVLKGHLTEMVETTVSVEDRRPVTLSSKLLNSFFRKSRVNMPMNMNQLPPKSPSIASMLMQQSGSMHMPNKVPPPPGLQTQPGPHHHHHHHHNGIGHPFPPPMSHGPAGLLGTIKRLFSFAPMESRYDFGMGPNFSGRNMYTSNGTHLPYIDGPSPRSSHFPPQIILPHPNMVHQYPPVGTRPMQSRMSNAHPPPPTSSSTASRTSNEKSKSSSTTTPKPSKKKKKSSSTQSKKPLATEESKWQNSRLTSSSSTKLPSGTFPIKISTTTTTTPTTSTAKPILASNKSSSHYNGSYNASTAYTRNVMNSNNKKISFTPSTPFKENNNKPSSQVKGDSQNLSSKKATTEVILTKRIGTTSDAKDHQSSKPVPKLDMFQTILGSTRSVLNYFKATEGRKSLGNAPTVLEPRSASTNIVVESKSLKET